MKHNPTADPPNFEIAPSALVTYVRYDANPYTYDDEPFRVLVDGVEVGAYCVVESPVKEARRFAAMLEAVYDRGTRQGWKDKEDEIVRVHGVMH